MQIVDNLLERVTELLFSPVAGKILVLARDDCVGARDRACRNPNSSLTPRSLKIANSPYYGQARGDHGHSSQLGIDTISSLATVLGSFADAAADNGALPTMRELGEHSVSCSTVTLECGGEVSFCDVNPKATRKWPDD